MDSLITAAARALASGDAIGALKRVALRDDAPALALRGIAMAQLGDLVRAKTLLRNAARAFGPKETVARARCVVAEAEIALVSRDLGWPAKALDAARATLEAHGDRVNAAHARNLAVRRLLLIGRLDEAEQALAEVDPASFPPAWKAAHQLVVAGIAIRRLRIRTAREALARAERTARAADIPVLMAEVESASLVLNTPAARLIARGNERPLLLEDVEALLASKAMVVDACRYAERDAGTVVSLATRPVLFALARALAEAWPADVSRDALVARAFRGKHADESHRAVAGRDRAASRRASDAGRCERDQARLCAGAAPRPRGRRTGAAGRRAARGGARLPRRWRVMVEFGARNCAWRQSAHRAARTRRAWRGGQGAIIRSRARASLDDPAGAGLPDNLVTPGSAPERLELFPFRLNPG
jgi:hypothetical protein